MDRALRLKPRVRNYAWGTRDFIPERLGEPPSAEPVAEAWFGAHPSAPSTLDLPVATKPLDALSDSERAALLGPRVTAEFNGFPFLLKLLSAAHPLSIQVHPSKSQARAGFVRDRLLPEAERDYGDENHKLELFVALTEFRALCGFRRSSEIARELGSVPELAEQLPPLGAGARSLRRLVEAYHRLDDEKRSRALLSWLARCERAAKGTLDLGHWAVAAHRKFSEPGRADAGLFYFLLLNFVTLQPGQGLFLPSGVVHAYLGGSGIEVMSSSDNVLRAGLTKKPINVAELLRVTRFEASPPWLLSAPENGARREAFTYHTPAVEFELSLLDLPANGVASATSDGPAVLLVVEGSLEVCSGPYRLPLARGQSCVVPHGLAHELSSPGSCRVARVIVPPTREPTFRGRRPTELSFGTSGLRGLISDITDLEAYVNVRGFLDFLVECGDALPGASLALAGDLRPSTDGAERSILRATLAAIRDGGFEAIYLGTIPTPALLHYAARRSLPSIMVTGSHIPFDRNGIKFNMSTGEVLKSDEAAIAPHVAEVRRRVYAEPVQSSPFDDRGMLRELPELPPQSDQAKVEYVARYTEFFAPDALAGLCIAVYQHSAVGRDVLVEILERLGARVIPFGKSDGFVAIDTEAITARQLDDLRREVDSLSQAERRIHAVVSTDGDSDRPLVVSIDPGGELHFHGGDRVGIVTAAVLGADAVVVPASATDAVELHFSARGVPVVRTKIGSPHVVAKLDRALGECRVGWETNGGFLLGSSIERGGHLLARLPTRDAMLPIVSVLQAANELRARAAPQDFDVGSVFDALPARFTGAALLDGVTPSLARALLSDFTPSDASLLEVRLNEPGAAPRAVTENGERPIDPALLHQLAGIRARLEARLSADFGRVEWVNYLDGVRIGFENGEIVHLRASGNAPQMRIYAVASSAKRAAAIAEQGVADSGLLPTLLEGARRRLREVAILENVALAQRILPSGEPPRLVGYVCGSAAAQRFWQRRLTEAQSELGAQEVVALHEDLPVNQAFGVLLAWERIEHSWRSGEGALLSFVFGEGTRATPFTETDNGQKPAMLSFVRTVNHGRQLSMAELALRQFAPVEAYLRRSGFDGVVIKWGDEVQIPSVDLSGTDVRFEDADVVRFVSLRRVSELEAQSKDWLGVDETGRITRFIPRRPLVEMEKLAVRGVLQKRGDAIIAGVNLGSIAISRHLLDALHHEFARDLTVSDVRRGDRPDLDPQFFSALTLALIDDESERREGWQRAVEDTRAMRDLAAKMPDALHRLRRAVLAFGEQHRRKPRFVALDLGEPYWGDIGQHRQIYDFYMALIGDDANAAIARALAGLPKDPDANGNFIVRSRLGREVVARNSALIDCELDGPCQVDNSVLIGTRCHSIHAERAFDVASRVTSLKLAPRAGSYRVVADSDVVVASAQRVTSVFLDGERPLVLSVHEDTDLRDRAHNYEVTLGNNRISFEAAHRAATATDPAQVDGWRAAAETRVLEKIRSAP